MTVTTDPSKPTRRTNGAQTVERAARVLRVVGRLRAARFSVLSRETGLANPTLRRMLVSLIDAQLVFHDQEQGVYKLGSEAYVLGQLARAEYGFHDLSRTSLSRLADLSGDCVFLSALEGLSIICLHREEGRFPIRTHVLNVGDRHPLGVGAGSLAILAALPADEADTILQNNADRICSVRESLNVDQLSDLVRQARIDGFAVNPGLVFPYSWAIAAAIRAPSGEILGAITIAAIETRMHEARQRELSVALLEEVSRVERLLAQYGTDSLRLGKEP